MLLKEHAADVRVVDLGVDKHKEGVGKLARGCGDGVGLQKAGGEDEFGALRGDVAQALGGRVGGTFKLEHVDHEPLVLLELAHGLREAVPGALVKRAVELAARVEGDAEDVVLGGCQRQREQGE